MDELTQKLDLVRALLDQQHLDALLLQRVSSVAWATCGASSYVNTATSTGVASVLITSSARYLVVDNIEAARLEQEEGLGRQRWEFRVHPWYAPEDTVGQLAGALKLGTDSCRAGAADLSEEVARLRADLTPAEDERFRALGHRCAEAMDQAIRAVRPGQTEFEMAGLLERKAQDRGVQPIVVLVAADDRIFRYRHPLPTDRRLEQYAMLVLCGRKWGLVCSITRLVHFGPLSEELRRREQACARVDAAFISATRPGNSIAAVFDRGANEYAAVGFPDEWQLHHQGGPAGYEPREFLATPTVAGEVHLGQVFAWNPSITGCKCEDSVLVAEKGNEVLTYLSGWPSMDVSLPDGSVLGCPAILEIR